MATYSPIKYFIILNFRNLGEVTIDFSESPIVSLIGDNESGKTSVVKAFGVCAAHTDFRSQKDYIRDGTSAFGVAIILEDGTKIIRQKGTGTSSNKYRIVNPDGTIKWEAQKLEAEIPLQVQELMGLIEEPETKELIHIRTYEDQLLFVVTPASTNYKVMYDALKISQITRAIKAGSTEANALKSKISQAEVSMNTLQKSLSNIRTYDIEPLLNVRNKLQEDLGIIAKFDRIASIKRDIELKQKEIGAIDLIRSQSLTEIDSSEVDKLNRIGLIIDSINTLKSKNVAFLELSNLEPVDTALMEKLNNACENKRVLSEINDKNRSYAEIAELDVIPVDEISKFGRIDEIQGLIRHQQKLYDIYDSNLSKASSIDESEFTYLGKLSQISELADKNESTSSTLTKINEYVDGVINWMKAVGVATTSCPKCGESIIIDLDAMGNNG